MKISKKEKFYYGIGNLGYSTISSTLSNFIMFFGTSVMGVSGTLVGLAVSIGVFWDAISDPIVGYYSDNLNSSLGKRHPFMLIGIFGMCAINLVIWLIPANAPEIIKFIWIFLSLIAVQTFCTFFATPHLALGLEMSSDPQEQTSIQCIRTIFQLIGMMLPTIFMFIFMPSGEGVQGQLLASGYINTAYVSSLLCLIFGLMTFFGTLKRQVCCPVKIKTKKESILSIFNDFFKILKKKRYRIIISGYSISLIASSILTASGMHMFTYCFHFDSKQISIAMGSLIISAILAQIFWSHVSKSIGKKQTLIRGLVIGIIGILVLWGLFTLRQLFSTNVLFILTLPSIFISGFGTGVLYSFPLSMFGDVMANDYEIQGTNKTGVYSGIMTLAFKLSNSLALVIIGIVLDLIKFSSDSPVQPLSVQTGLGLLVIVGTILSLGISILIFNKYDEK